MERLLTIFRGGDLSALWHFEVPHSKWAWRLGLSRKLAVFEYLI